MKVKKLLTVVLMVSMFVSVFSFPPSVSAQDSEVTAYSSAAEWLQDIDIADWAQNLGKATYSNIDDWTENPSIAEWAEESDILSYADDIVYAYEYEQTEEQIEISGEIDTKVIIHADGTDEIICSFPFIINQTAQTKGIGDGDSETQLLRTSLTGDGNGNLTAKVWWSSKPSFNYKIKMSLYYGTCRIEKPSNLKDNTGFLTSIGTSSNPATLKVSISTTKYHMIRLSGDGWTTTGTHDSNIYLFNKKAVKYPEYTDPKSGKYAVGPYYSNFKAERLDTWNQSKRDKYRKWYADTYYGGTVPWNWKDYHVHHIRPLQYGGLSDNENLIPLKIAVHNKFNTWWKSYA